MNNQMTKNEQNYLEKVKQFAIMSNMPFSTIQQLQLASKKYNDMCERAYAKFKSMPKEAKDIFVKQMAHSIWMVRTESQFQKKQHVALGYKVL